MAKKVLFVLVLLIVVGICINVLVENSNMVSKDLNFEQTLIKTGAYFNEIEGSTAKIIKSILDINEYVLTYNDEQLKNELKIYNDTYFLEKTLVIIAIQESSGSNWNTLKTLKIIDNKLICSVVRHQPEVGTCDMAMNYILVQVDKKDIINVKNVVIE
ncbi:MAG: hypothetical protein PHH22_01690 [Clostridia bacterium]|nr:hypothetical protein [Clostridia bacterium]